MSAAPLISGEAVMGIISAIAAAGVGIVTFLRWAVNAWLSDRKEDRTERAKDREVQVELQLSVAALVERDRIREERRRRESSAPSIVSRVPSREFDVQEDTNVTSIKERLRREAAAMPRKTPATGVRRNTPDEDR